MSKLLEAAQKKRPDAVKLLESNPLRVQIARQLRTARKEAGLTQAQLATESGMSQPVISGMESPTGPMPEVDSMDRFMRACGKKLWLGFETGDEAVQVIKQQRKLSRGLNSVVKRAALHRYGKFKRAATVRKGSKVLKEVHPIKQFIVSAAPGFVQVAAGEKVYAVIGNKPKDQKGAGVFVGTVSPISLAQPEPSTAPEGPSQLAGKPKSQ